jgi:hypothetical protein
MVLREISYERMLGGWNWLRIIPNGKLWVLVVLNFQVLLPEM